MWPMPRCWSSACRSTRWYPVRRSSKSARCYQLLCSISQYAYTSKRYCITISVHQSHHEFITISQCHHIARTIHQYITTPRYHNITLSRYHTNTFSRYNYIANYITTSRHNHIPRDHPNNEAQHRSIETSSTTPHFRNR